MKEEIFRKNLFVNTETSKKKHRTYAENANEVKRILEEKLRDDGIKITILKDDPEIALLYRKLTMYFSNNPDFEKFYVKNSNGDKIYYSLRKGILLAGDKGRSKSYIMERVMKEFTNKFYPENSYKCNNSNDIAKDFEEHGMKALNNYRKLRTSDQLHHNMYIDEVGAEPLIINHYGTIIHPMKLVLSERNRIFTGSRSKCKTHISTNWDIPDFIKYDSEGRVLDRLYEMYNFIYVRGNSLRKLI